MITASITTELEKRNNVYTVCKLCLQLTSINVMFIILTPRQDDDDHLSPSQDLVENTSPRMMTKLDECQSQLIVNHHECMYRKDDREKGPVSR